MINKDYAYIPLQAADYATKLPLDFLAKAMGQLQERSDRNYIATQELPGLLNVPVDEADFQRRAKIQRQVKDKIDQTVAKYNNNLSHAGKDVYSLQSYVKGLMSPSGALGAMSGNYNQIREYQKSILENKTISDSEKAQAIKYSKQRFRIQGGTGEVDPITGRYNVFSGHRLTGFDMQKYLKDYTKIEAMLEEKTGSRYNPNTGYFEDIHTSQEINDPQRIKAILKAGLFNSTDFREWYKGRAEMGMTVGDDEIEQAIEAESNARAFGKYKEDVDYRWNKMMDYNLDLEKFRYKKQRDAKEDALSWSYTGIDQSNTGYKDLTHKDLNTLYTNEVEETIDPMTGAIMRNPVVLGVPKNTVLDYNHPNAKNNESLKRSMEFAAAKINPNFHNLTGPQINDYFKELDTNKKDAFRNLVLNDYNTREKNIHERSTGQINITSPKHSKAVTESILLQASSLPVFGNTDIHLNGPNSKGNLQDYINGLEGHRQVDKLEKKGDYKARAVGVNPDGTVNMVISVYDGDKTKSETVRVPNRNQGQMDVYKETVSLPFGKSGTQQKPVYDPLVGKGTWHVQSTNIRDNNGNFLDYAEEKTSNGNDRILKMNSFDNLRAGTVYKLDDGSYFNTNDLKQIDKQTFKGTIIKNGKVQNIFLHSKQDVLSDVAKRDPIFYQNLENKEQRQQTEDSDEY